jgi:hypothetical protein
VSRTEALGLLSLPANAPVRGKLNITPRKFEHPVREGS